MNEKKRRAQRAMTSTVFLAIVWRNYDAEERHHYFELCRHAWGEYDNAYVDYLKKLDR